MVGFEQEENRRYPLRAVAAWTLLTWLVALALLVVAFWLIDHSQHRHLVQLLGGREPTLADRGAGAGALADQPAVRDWTFELGGSEPRFGDRYGEAWARVAEANGDTGQATIGDDLFIWRRAAPAAEVAGQSLSGPGAKGWVLVSRVSRQALAAAGTDMRQLLWRWFAVLAAVALAAATALAHHQVRRRQHLRQVEASEARFQKLVESIPDAIIIVDDAGRIRLVNARAADWFGYRPQELLGRPVEVLIPEPLRERHQRHRSAYMAQPSARAMGAGAQFVARRRDGSEFPVEISLSPLATAGDTLVIAMVRDITERRQLELAREEAQARYRRLLDNLPLGVFRSSMSERLADDRRFLEVNPALVAMFEAGRTERLLACPPARLYHDDAERAALVAELFALGAVVGRELGMVTLSGRVFDARLSVVMRRDAAGNRFVDGVVEDVSARRAAERERDSATLELQRRAAALEAANRELDAFSHSASHDLQVPLGAIDGFSSILEQEYGECLDSRGRDHLAGLRNAVGRMAAQIDALSGLSRVTRAELKLEPVDLSALAAAALTGLQQRDPGRRVRCSIQPGMCVLGDARLLRVVLDNLLENAWKFTMGRAEAMIEFGAQEEADHNVFYLHDNGIGFDMAHADKLFGAFQRLHDVNDFAGTGIGLATVQRVIHKHGGQVWAEAEVDRGATFFFTLGSSLSGYEGSA